MSIHMANISLLNYRHVMPSSGCVNIKFKITILFAHISAIFMAKWEKFFIAPNGHYANYPRMAARSSDIVRILLTP